MDSVYLGDAVQFMQQLKDSSVQLIWTDPPFGTNKKQTIESTGKSYKDGSVDDVTDLMTNIGREAQRVLTDSGVMAVCLDYRAVHQVYVALMGCGLKPQGEIIWSFGLGKPSQKWWANKHNTVLLFSKTDNPLFKYEEVPEVTRKAPKPGYAATKKATSVWDITLSNTDPERVGYPNQKPEELIEPFVLVHTNINDLVIDPFGGSGSTAAIAKKLGRNYATADINPVAVETIITRLISISEENNEPINN